MCFLATHSSSLQRNGENIERKEEGSDENFTACSASFFDEVFNVFSFHFLTFQCLVRLGRCNVVTHNGRGRILVIHGRQSLELFLSSRIPYLNLGRHIVDGELFGNEKGAHGWVACRIAVVALGKAQHEGCLAGKGLAQHDDLYVHCGIGKERKGEKGGVRGLVRPLACKKKMPDATPDKGDHAARHFARHGDERRINYIQSCIAYSNKLYVSVRGSRYCLRWCLSTHLEFGLRELDVWHCGNKCMRFRCRKKIGKYGSMQLDWPGLCGMYCIVFNGRQRCYDAPL